MEAVRLRGLDRPGDLGWIVGRHGELYAAEHGWDRSFEALVARIVADFAAGHDPAREAGWIAEVDGRRAGCVLCVASDGDGAAKLRALPVEPFARDRGVGRLLVDRCISLRARRATRGSSCGPRPTWRRPDGFTRPLGSAWWARRARPRSARRC